MAFIESYMPLMLEEGFTEPVVLKNSGLISNIRGVVFFLEVVVKSCFFRDLWMLFSLFLRNTGRFQDFWLKEGSSFLRLLWSRLSLLIWLIKVRV